MTGVHFMKKIIYLGIKYVQDKLHCVIVWTRWHHGAKLEENVGGHGIDPEHEGGECVEGEITNSDATKGCGGEQATQAHTEIVPGKTNIGDKVIEDKSNGNLSKQRSMQVRIN
jgi:hypothetical protein